jgi:hypothetical protein
MVTAGCVEKAAVGLAFETPVGWDVKTILVAAPAAFTVKAVLVADPKPVPDAKRVYGMAA